MHWATFSGCIDIVRYLIKKYSRRFDLISSTNMDHDSPLHIACRHHQWSIAE
jgi:ankyrin repeat protein